MNLSHHQFKRSMALTVGNGPTDSAIAVLQWELVCDHFFCLRAHRFLMHIPQVAALSGDHAVCTARPIRGYETLN